VNFKIERANGEIVAGVGGELNEDFRHLDGALLSSSALASFSGHLSVHAQLFELCPASALSLRFLSRLLADSRSPLPLSPLAPRGP